MRASHLISSRPRFPVIKPQRSLLPVALDMSMAITCVIGITNSFIVKVNQFDHPKEMTESYGVNIVCLLVHVWVGGWMLSFLSVSFSPPPLFLPNTHT